MGDPTIEDLMNALDDVRELAYGLNATDSRFRSRNLSIAITHIETAMLWADSPWGRQDRNS